MTDYIHVSDGGEVRFIPGEAIIRCRDCKNFTPKGTHEFDNGLTNEDYCKYVRGYLLRVSPDGFCKWGEPKEGGE